MWSVDVWYLKACVGGIPTSSLLQKYPFIPQNASSQSISIDVFASPISQIANKNETLRQFLKIISYRQQIRHDAGNQVSFLMLSSLTIRALESDWD